MKDKDHALADFDRAIELNPAHAAGYNSRGSLYLSDGRFRPCFVRLRPGDRAPAALRQGSCRTGTGKPEKGRSQRKAWLDIDRALSLDPDSAYVHNVKADILAALGRRNEAIAAYKKALAIAPDLQESVQGLKALQRTKP